MSGLSEYIIVNENKSPVVKLERALHDDVIIGAFVPVKSTLDVFSFLQDAASTHSTSFRSALCHGAYGSGKSYMTAVLCRLFMEGFDCPALQPVWSRMRARGWDDKLNDLRNVMLAGDNEWMPWLVVPLYAGGEGATLENVLLKSLIKQVKKAGLNTQQIIGHTWYEAAAKRFDDVLALGTAFEPQEGGVFQSAEELKRALCEDADDTAYLELEKWHNKVCMGAELQDTLQQDGLCRVEDAYARAAASLPEYGFRGILVLWDEFGFALEELLRGHRVGKRDLGQEVMALQQLLERCCDTKSYGNGLTIFMGFTHFGLGEYGTRSGVEELAARRLLAVKERFVSPDISIRLNTAEAEGYHLLSGMITQTEKGQELLQDDLPNWRKLASLMQSFSLWKDFDADILIRDVIKPTYPLHPASATILLRLSDFIAQVSRTAFYFMVDRTSGLCARIQEKELPGERDNIGSSELVRPHELFAFFESALRENEPAQYRRYAEALRRLPADDTEAVELLHLVLILLVSQVEVTTNMLCLCMVDARREDLVAERVNASLDRCVKARVLSRNEHTDIWSFGVPGVDVEEIIAKEMKDVSIDSSALYIQQTASIQQELIEYLGLFDLDPAPSGIIRKVRVVVPDLRLDAKQWLSLNPAVGTCGVEWCSATIYIMIPESEDALKAWHTHIEALPTSQSYFMLPDRAVELDGDMRRLVAVMRLLERGGMDHERQAVFEDIFAHLREELRGEFMRYYTENGFWVQKAGQTQRAFTAMSWYDVFERVGKSVLQDCRQEVLVRCPVYNEWVTKKSKRLRNIIQRIIHFEQTPAYHAPFLGFSEKMLESAVIDGVLVENRSLTTNLQDQWVLKDYSDKDTERPVLIDVIRKYFLTGGQKKDAQKLFNMLIEPPYAIPNGIIPVLVALAIRTEFDRVAFFSESGSQVVTSSIPEVLEKISFAPASCVFRHENLGGEHRVAYQALAAVLDYQIPEHEYQGSAFYEHCRKLVQKLGDWAKGLPEMVVGIESLREDERMLIRRMRQGVPPDIRDLSELTLKMFRQHESADQELAAADKKTRSFPEVTKAWNSLGERIARETEQSRDLVEKKVETVPDTALQLIGLNPDEREVDQVVATLTGKDKAALRKDDYTFVDGVVSVIDEICPTSSLEMKLVGTDGLRKIHMTDKPETPEKQDAENRITQLLYELQEQYGLKQDDLSAICLKVLYRNNDEVNSLKGQGDES